MTPHISKSLGTVAMSVALAASAHTALAGFVTSVIPYAEPTTPEYSIFPLWSVNDAVPRTSDTNQQFRMIGIPDGLGAYASSSNTITVFMNHELRETVRTQPVIGGTTNLGAFVTKIIHSAADGSVLSADLAYTEVYNGTNYVGPIAQVGNSTPPFSRFCSASLVPVEAGMDRPVFLSGEESGGTATFDGLGGVMVAIADGKCYAIPEAGHFPWENEIARPAGGELTVIMGLEDGPSTPDSQLYMYVGVKDPSATDFLGRNGLRDGSLYVWVANRKQITSEVQFTGGQIQGKWVKIENAATMTDVETEAAADAVGAFGFIRIEDGAFRPGNPNEFYFVTTGATIPGSTEQPNTLGRLYKLELNPDNVLGPSKLRLVYDADDIIAAGGDIALSPDNIDVSSDYIMIQEDGTSESRPVMAALGRQGGIWRLDLNNNFAADYVAEFTGVGRTGLQTAPGVWETSGIIDMSGILGFESWLFDVQAHGPTPAPAPLTAEDGQLLLMIRNAP